MKERALDKYNKYTENEAPETPLERLTFFLSLGLDGQDWLDVEPFLTAVRNQIEEYKQDAERYRWLKEYCTTESYDGDLGLKFRCDFENWNCIDAAIDAAMEKGK